LSVDDFYEKYAMAIDLMFYAITGEILAEEDKTQTMQSDILDNDNGK